MHCLRAVCHSLHRLWSRSAAKVFCFVYWQWIAFPDCKLRHYARYIQTVKLLNSPALAIHGTCDLDPSLRQRMDGQWNCLMGFIQHWALQHSALATKVIRSPLDQIRLPLWRVQKALKDQHWEHCFARPMSERKYLYPTEPKRYLESHRCMWQSVGFDSSIQL